MIKLNTWISCVLALGLTLGCWCKTVCAADEDIPVGVILPLSGALASYGRSTLNGIELAVKQVNEAGGIGGRKIVLSIEDNKGTTTDSRNAYNKLVGSDKVVAVLGPITSTNAMSVRRHAKKLEVPVISPTATNDKVTRKNDYLFRTCFNDSFQGQIIANYAIQSRKHTKAAVLIDMNSDYSKGLSASFKKAFAAGGGAVVAEEGYQQKDTEFGVQLKKIKESGAEVLFVPGYPPELPLIIKQAKVIGLAARLCGADGWDNQAVINGSGDNVEGCFIVGAFSREDKRPVVQGFLKAFQAMHNAPGGTFEALGHDSVTLLAEALKTGLTASAVVKGLLQIKGKELITGKTSISSDGDAVKSAVVLSLTKRGEKYVTKYLETVNP